MKAIACLLVVAAACCLAEEPAGEVARFPEESWTLVDTAPDDQAWSAAAEVKTKVGHFARLRAKESGMAPDMREIQVTPMSSIMRIARINPEVIRAQVEDDRSSLRPPKLSLPSRGAEARSSNAVSDTVQLHKRLMQQQAETAQLRHQVNEYQEREEQAQQMNEGKEHIVTQLREELRHTEDEKSEAVASAEREAREVEAEASQISELKHALRHKTKAADATIVSSAREAKAQQKVMAAHEVVELKQALHQSETEVQQKNKKIRELEGVLETRQAAEKEEAISQDELKQEKAKLQTDLKRLRGTEESKAAAAASHLQDLKHKLAHVQTEMQHKAAANKNLVKRAEEKDSQIGHLEHELAVQEASTMRAQGAMKAKSAELKASNQQAKKLEREAGDVKQLKQQLKESVARMKAGSATSEAREEKLMKQKVEINELKQELQHSIKHDQHAAVEASEKDAAMKAAATAEQKAIRKATQHAEHAEEAAKRATEVVSQEQGARKAAEEKAAQAENEAKNAVKEKEEAVKAVAAASSSEKHLQEENKQLHSDLEKLKSDSANSKQKMESTLADREAKIRHLQHQVNAEPVHAKHPKKAQKQQANQAIKQATPQPSKPKSASPTKQPKEQPTKEEAQSAGAEQSRKLAGHLQDERAKRAQLEAELRAAMAEDGEDAGLVQGRSLMAKMSPQGSSDEDAVVPEHDVHSAKQSGAHNSPPTVAAWQKDFSVSAGGYSIDVGVHLHKEREKKAAEKHKQEKVAAEQRKESGVKAKEAAAQAAQDSIQAELQAKADAAQRKLYEAEHAAAEQAVKRAMNSHGLAQVPTTQLVTESGQAQKHKKVAELKEKLAKTEKDISSTKSALREEGDPAVRALATNSVAAGGEEESSPEWARLLWDGISCSHQGVACYVDSWGSLLGCLLLIVAAVLTFGGFIPQDVTKGAQRDPWAFVTLISGVVILAIAVILWVLDADENVWTHSEIADACLVCCWVILMAAAARDAMHRYEPSEPLVYWQAFAFVYAIPRVVLCITEHEQDVLLALRLTMLLLVMCVCGYAMMELQMVMLPEKPLCPSPPSFFSSTAAAKPSAESKSDTDTKDKDEGDKDSRKVIHKKRPVGRGGRGTGGW